jgi:transposase
MWKPEHRIAADRSGLRYPSDLTGAEWAVVEPMVPPAKHGGRKRTIDVRESLNGIFYVLWTGCQWQALPKDAQSTPVLALTVSGMNDVLNSQGYTQAAWWNRIPAAAWILMGLIAIVSNLLLGYRERSTGLLVLLVVPVVSSIAFFLIADIDSPRGGVIRVVPHNLIAVSQVMNPHQRAP